MSVLLKYKPYHCCRASFGLIMFLALPYFIKATSGNPALMGLQSEIILPFEYRQGFIVVDVIFQKKIPLKFILDTGAENTILLKKEYAQRLNVPYAKRIKLIGSDMNKDIFAYVCNGTYLQLVNTQTVQINMIVLEDDMISMDEYIGMPIDGILGADFFKGLILKINYRRKEVTISDPSKYNYKKLKDYEAFDIDVINSKPYLKIKSGVARK